MGDIPKPRSYQTILSDAINTFISKAKIKGMKVGGPILSILEASAQNDTRATQDAFSILDAQSIDRATGIALINIGLSENVTKIPVTAASGFVTFLDTSFAKISSTIFQGAAAPNVGSTTIRVSDATAFPNSGSVYIGRGTANYEGPIAYTKVDSTTLSVPSGTVKFHNVGESVILSKGGVRIIDAGTAIQTPQGNVSDAVKFNTLYTAQIEDGEVSVENVEVIAATPGTIGNVPAGAIKEVVSAPFAGASVTNPLPFTNGLPEESDEDFRERIKNVRQSRAKGTSLAITTGVLGAFSKQDNKTVTSASFVSRQNEAATLYIDDGTGYEEATAGVAQETIVDSALGGEQLFQLSTTPVTRAFVKTVLSAPYVLSAGDKLSVKVGGVVSEVAFESSQFKSISNATAYEIVSAINGNSDLLFQARTANQGTKISLFAKSDDNDDIEVVAPDIGKNANIALGFSSGVNYALRLFKNDRLLLKDGRKALLNSKPQSGWALSITNGDTLIVQVDGTASQTVTITDADFVNNATGFSTVSVTNTLDSWVTVLNAKITGATAVAAKGGLTLESNLGADSRAKIAITGGTLVTKGMFDVASATGATSDYTLDRNTGQFKLAKPLAEGDNLVVASDNTRAYIQSSTATTISFGATANFYLSIDGSASVLSTGVNGATSLTVSSPGANRAKYLATNNTFGSGSTGYIKNGDWLILWDPAFTDRGVYRVSSVDTVNWSWFEVERAVINTQPVVSPASSGFVFVRSTTPIQQVSISAGSYSLTSLINAFNASLIGAFATDYRNTKLRIVTNTFGDGNVMLVTADLEGKKLGFPSGVLKTNNVTHYPVIQSLNKESGTPNFKWTTIGSVLSPTTFTLTNPSSSIGLTTGDMLTFRRRIAGYGTNADSRSVPANIDVSDVITLNPNSELYPKVAGIRVYSASPFRLSAEDSLTVLLDADTNNKNYNINTYRNIQTGGGATYGTSAFAVLDSDNAGQSLYKAFGTTTNLFNDFALFMNARGKSYSTTVNKTILWRNAKFGPHGNDYKISFINPSAPNLTGFGLTTNTVNGYGSIQIRLPSSAERTGLNVSGATQFVVSANKTYSIASGSLARATTTVTATVSANASLAHDLEVGDQVYLNTDEPNFRGGPKTVTAVTANSFSYTESGSTTVSSQIHSFMVSKRPAGTSNTVTALTTTGTTATATIGTHIFNVGDTVYFQPGHFDATSGISINAGAKVITAKTGTTITWAEVTAAGTANLVASVTYKVSTGLANKITLVAYKAEAPIGSLSRTGAVVTATIATNPLASKHSFKAGDLVYLSPGEANFPSGAKLVTSATNTTFTYVETGTAGVSTAIQYFSPTFVDINLTGGGTPVAAGHIAHVDSAGNLDTNVEGDFRVFSVSSNRFSILKDSSAYSGNTVPTALGGSAYLRFYPINAASAKSSDVVTWINANTSLVKATLVPENGGSANDGTAQITTATNEEYLLGTNNASYNGSGNQSVAAWPLFDGVNYVSATNIGVGTSTIALKNPVSGELTANADFANEKFRLVPLTAANLQSWFSAPAVSAFAINGSSATSDNGSRLELLSNTLGSSGLIKVNGGSANNVVASIVGNGSVVASAYTKVSILSTQATGLDANMWVKLQGSGVSVKNTAFNSSTTAAIANTGVNEWKVTLSSNAINVIQSITSTNTYQVEKHGKFMAFIDISGSPTALSASIKEGDYVYVNVAGMSAANVGIKQIVKIDISTNTFWVEGVGVEEAVTLISGDFVQFLSYDSAIPGDRLLIGTTVLGSANMGEFAIKKLSFSGTTIVPTEFYVTGSMTAIAATVLGGDYVFFQIKEGTPIALFKKIKTLIPNTASVGYTDILLYSADYATKISSAAYCTMTALDKLNFTTGSVAGLDGYSYNTGLLQEVNRVAYGDVNSPSVYPGFIAAGANVNIAGPLVKRIAVSLSIRIRTGVSANDISDRVKNTVAATINASPVGQSIAISDIVSAANGIDGVISVTIISPAYNSGNDLIKVQANEKPRVLDIDQDIFVTILT